MTDLNGPQVQALARIIDPHAYWDQEELNRNHRRRNTRALMAAHRVLEALRAQRADMMGGESWMRVGE